MGNDELKRLFLQKNREDEIKSENTELKLLFLDMDDENEDTPRSKRVQYNSQKKTQRQKILIR